MHSEWIFNQIESLNIKKKINLLDFASGGGRNCIPLSKKNINVTAIDIDQEKLNKYKSFKNINTICFDLETTEQWPLVKGYYDVIIVVNYLYRPKIKKLRIKFFLRAVSSVGRASRLHREGRRFETVTAHQNF